MARLGTVRGLKPFSYRRGDKNTLDAFRKQATDTYKHISKQRIRKNSADRMETAFCPPASARHSALNEGTWPSHHSGNGPRLQTRRYTTASAVPGEIIPVKTYTYFIGITHIVIDALKGGITASEKKKTSRTFRNRRTDCNTLSLILQPTRARHQNLPPKRLRTLSPPPKRNDRHKLVGPHSECGRMYENGTPVKRKSHRERTDRIRLVAKQKNGLWIYIVYI